MTPVREKVNAICALYRQAPKGSVVLSVPGGTIVVMAVDTGLKRRFGDLADLADRLVGASWRLGIGRTSATVQQAVAR